MENATLKLKVAKFFMMLGGQNKTFHWNNGVKKHFGWVCCHTQARGHMLLGSAGPTGEEGISANHAKVLQHILHFCPVLVRITARMQSEFVNSAHPPAKIPLKKKIKKHILCQNTIQFLPSLLTTKTKETDSDSSETSLHLCNAASWEQPTAPCQPLCSVAPSPLLHDSASWGRLLASSWAHCC